MKAAGRVHKYGDHVDTDVILPARYITLTSPEELAAHCMEDIDREFVAKVRSSDVMLAGENFGCGSSREHAPIAIKAAGISCVIAKSFARIFYRNAINTGLAILECPEIWEETSAGDELEVNFTDGIIINRSSGKQYQSQPFPAFIQEIMAAGGLLSWIRLQEKGDV